jgi:hypothetical protein
MFLKTSKNNYLYNNYLLKFCCKSKSVKITLGLHTCHIGRLFNKLHDHNTWLWVLKHNLKYAYGFQRNLLSLMKV